MPTSAVAFVTAVEIFVSVNRPVTREGLMSNVTPLPLDVEMSALKICTPVPPLKLPSVPIAHDAGVPLALKLPLDCARAGAEPKATTRAATAKADAYELICFLRFSSRGTFMPRVSVVTGDARRRWAPIRADTRTKVVPGRIVASLTMRRVDPGCSRVGIRGWQSGRVQLQFQCH